MTDAKLKVAIAASHRFHLADLAEQLALSGHEVTFFSYLPPKRLVRLKEVGVECVSFFWLLSPLLLFVKATRYAALPLRMLNAALDELVARRLFRCDFFVGLGGVYSKAFVRAKNLFGCATILEWGSKHILVQEQLLKVGGTRKALDEYFVNRILESYDRVDFIAVPSRQVVDSFNEVNYSTNRLFLNRYGVDLLEFPPTTLKDDLTFDVICVGAWSSTKGSDLLAKVCLARSWRVLHVGAIVDVDFPESPLFVHHDPVPQHQLTLFYSKARVLALPSRSEGFGMVLLQGVASGLPLVCSAHTGGPDLLSDLSTTGDHIFVMGDFSEAELTASLEKALTASRRQPSGIPRDYIRSDREALTWAGYAARYTSFMRGVIEGSQL